MRSIIAFNDAGDRVPLLVVDRFSSDPRVAEPVGATIRTREGQTLRRVRKGEYIVMATRRRLTSDDPDAP